MLYKLSIMIQICDPGTCEAEEGRQMFSDNPGTTVNIMLLCSNVLWFEIFHTADRRLSGLSSYLKVVQDDPQYSFAESSSIQEWHCGDSIVCHHVPSSIPPGWILVDSFVWYVFSYLSGMNRS